ncbi:MAG: AbrB/MazE/SpoVT family DNA-binding domain-containing protein [Solirubrobacterales bacterium]|nr:AbrB/MazE/SpoVT family DNA-binding domain-containing protein [Solirubrobacterales bacterium]
MRATIDKAGRLVVPKQIRERLSLEGGAEIEIEVVDGRIEISRPFRDEPLVETEDGLLTFAGGPGLSVEETRDLIERQRMRHW